MCVQTDGAYAEMTLNGSGWVQKRSKNCSNTAFHLGNAAT